MNKIYIFIGFALVTIALNSERAGVLAATTGNPFSDPMKEDIYSDSTVKNPSSDSMTGEVTELLGSSSLSSSESDSLGSSLNIAMNSTEAASSSTDTMNSTEAASSSTDTMNSTETASSSTDTINATEVPFSSATTLDLSREPNTNNNLNLTETSNFASIFDSTENVNSIQASKSVSSDLEPVPEPLTIFGTGLALGFGVLFNREYSKRHKATKNKSE